ncbi:unnamed protein product [Somion occarium]
MYGDSDRSVAYSLSGHIVISLSSAGSFFSYGRLSRLLLSSLVVTFEGQSELVTEETGYSAVRLCSISQECVPGEPVELTSEGQDEKSYTWNVVFNLTVPGWLPATGVFGQTTTGETGTRYALHAVAKFQSPSDNLSNSWLSALCLPLRFSSQVAKAPRFPIVLNRFMSPSPLASTSSSLFPLANYSVLAQPDIPTNEDGEPHVPPEVLSKLRVLVSIPEYIGSDEETIPLNLRLRTEDLSEDDCKRFRVEEFTVDVEQTERYRTVPLAAYNAQFPLPPRNEQPPHKPLLDPNPVQAIYELGLSSYPPRQVLTRAFSLLPEDVSGRYVLSGDGYIFTDDANSSDLTWYSMQTNVPFTKTHERDEQENDWKCKRILKQSSSSPFFGVNHRLYITLKCTYDLTEGENPERAAKHLTLHMPLRFVRTPPPTPSTSTASSPSPSSSSFDLSPSGLSSPTSTLDFPVASLPYANTLPAYSQLFDYNGDRKIDYSIPLPLYTPQPAADEKCQAASEQFENIPLQEL